MPTHDETEEFFREYRRLHPERQAQFRRSLLLFREGLESRRFHPSLRVKRYVSATGVWEMSWAPDGRATFTYGEELTPGSPHIVWLRIGSHDIFRS